jgi:hypothetical protein
MTDTFVPKNPTIFLCEHCDYNTSRIKDYNKHLSTQKHIQLTQYLHKNPLINEHNCECGRIYKHRQSLFSHKKKCSITKKDTAIIDTIVNENKTFKEFMMEQQQDFKVLIIELLKKETINNNINNINNTNNNINNNCNNQSFNLNFFLNEQCKDALNIDEFVDSIKMNLSDLENFAHLGYADGVSNIFAKGIKELGVHLRPIHCSDTKRETLYIKNNDEWIKETDDKPLITKAIKKVAFKNIKQINEWVKENPACKDPRTKKYDQYNKIVMNAMSGVTEEEQKNNIEKIVKNVTKSVAIEKYALC